MEDSEKAKEYYEDGIEVMEALCEERGGINNVYYLSRFYERLGNIFIEEQDMDMAAGNYSACVKCMENVVAESGTPRNRDELAYAIFMLGAARDYDKEQFKKAFHIWNLLALQFPDDEEYAKKRDSAKDLME